MSGQFYGTCTEEQLVRFCLKRLEVAKRLQAILGRLPKNFIFIPISKNRRNCYKINGCKDGESLPLKPKEKMEIGPLIFGLILARDTMGLKIISKRKKDTITFRRINRNENLFIFELFEKSSKSHHRKVIETEGIKINQI